MIILLIEVSGELNFTFQNFLINSHRVFISEAIVNLIVIIKF